MSALETVLANIEGKLSPDFQVADLRIEGLDTGPVLHVRGKEAVSTLFQYDVEVELDGPPPDLSFVIGARASLTVRDVTGHGRTIVGIVADIVTRAYDASTHRAWLVIRPSVHRQSLGRDCFAQQEVSTIDVVKEVLADYPGKLRYETTRTYPTYPYRVQYREDDWTYVSRILEEEGIYYWFDHEGDDSAVVFADHSESAPAIEGVPLLTYVEASGMRPDQEGVVEVSFESRMASTKFSGRSFDPDRPLLQISASDGEGHREHYDAPGAGPVEPATLSRRIADGREASAAARNGIAGLAVTTRLSPGRSFVLAGHPVARLTTDYFITEVEVEGSLKRPCVTRFKAIPKSVPFRPLRVTPEAKQAGIQMGKVVGPSGQEVHPDARGRVRAQLHWDRTGGWDDKSGTWMRIAQRGAPGSLLLPRMGWNVTTFNEEGGVEVPSILNRIHDAEHPPEYALPANKTRTVFKTPTTIGGGSNNEIYFEDAAGREEMFINASKDMNLRTRHLKNEFVERDSSREVGNDHTLHVDDSMSERVAGDQTIKIGNDEKVEVQDNVSKVVTGDETRSIGTDRTVTAGESITTDVKKNRDLSVGSAMTDVSLGEIVGNAVENTTKLIGGSFVRLSLESITDTANKNWIQAIGGAKLELAKGERTTSIAKTERETLEGSLSCETNEHFTDNADQLQAIDVKGAITGKAPDVWVEAVETIRVKCGSSTLTITKNDITFDSTALDLSGCALDAEATNITHN